MQRVQKLLSNYGYCSRRKAEELIDQGKVKVNGKTISLGDKASETDKITVDGKAVIKERKVYLLFNKPIRCVTALKDEQYRTVMSYIKVKERVFPIGRLDYNTSGLLLLTNDGDFANKVMHPSHEIKKTYLVELMHPAAREQISEIEKGVYLADGKTRPAKVNKLSPTLFEITIHEGKNKIVRRMFAKVGCKVKRLERVRIGSLSLGSLKPGMYKILGKKDLERVLK